LARPRLHVDHGLEALGISVDNLDVEAGVCRAAGDPSGVEARGGLGTDLEIDEQSFL
jgi:hypothetical protein